MATDFYQAWSHRWLGVATLDFTDSSGSYSVSTSTSVAANRDFCHLDLTAVNRDTRAASTVNTGYNDFAGWLQAAMNASGTTRNYVVAWSTDDLLYAILPDSGTVSLTFTGDAGALMRRILGFTGDKSGAASQTSDMRPWFVNRAQVDARTNWRLPTVIEGQVRAAHADDGTPYALAPTILVKSERWEHHFEPSASVRRASAVADTLAGGASWTWEDALEHAARYATPCVVRDADGSTVFYTKTPLIESSTRVLNRYIEHQIVTISADTIVGQL